MKRLALLLAAMGIISATALAEAPVLKVTNVGQELEIENESGDQNIGDTTFLTTVGFAYGDWSFGLTGAKFWKVDTKDGFTSNGTRVDLEAWKKINDNLKLGTKVRFEEDFDRYYLRYDYSYDWFWTSGDFWYNAVNIKDAEDNIELEWYPLGFKYGVFKAGWFVNYAKQVGEVKGLESKTEHQLRAWANLYKTEKLSIDTEVRVTLDYQEDHKAGTTGDVDGYTTFEDFGKNRVYLGATYSVNESLDIYGKYGYEIREKENSKTGKEDKSGNYFGDFIVGWSYKF